MKSRAELAEEVAKAALEFLHSGPATQYEAMEKLKASAILYGAWRNIVPSNPLATPTLNWRPHTEVPDPEDDAEACLIAQRNDDDGWYLVEGLFYFASHKGEPRCWLREDDLTEYKPDSRFFWLPESELLATLPETKK